ENGWGGSTMRLREKIAIPPFNHCVRRKRAFGKEVFSVFIEMGEKDEIPFSARRTLQPEPDDVRPWATSQAGREGLRNCQCERASCKRSPDRCRRRPISRDRLPRPFRHRLSKFR